MRLIERKASGIWFGSYSGMDTITRTLPVCGSIATTEPLRPAKPATAASVPATSRLVTTSRPSVARSSSPDRIDSNSFSSPTSSSLRDSSRLRRPFSMNE